MNIEKRLKKQMDFALEIDKEKNVFRRTHLSGHGRNENDAEHAWHMAIMAYLLKEYANEAVDIAKVMIMCLIHDLVEIDAGDTYAYDTENLKTQKAREEKAKQRIFSLLPEDQGQELMAVFDEFEEGRTAEAKFAHAMDNLQPLLLNNSNDGGDWREHGVSAEQVYRRQSGTKAGSEKLYELTDQILQEHIRRGNLKNPDSPFPEDLKGESMNYREILPKDNARLASLVREIPVTQIESIRVGQAENVEAGTGCTVVICEKGMRAGLDVRGGGPASRDTRILDPLMAAQEIHAVVLAGGSAFGLGTANGVMAYLEKKNIGFDVGVTKVPLVVQSDLFDLTVGDAAVRPDAEMGYEAAQRAMEEPNYRDGNYGAGCGATVGKTGGMETCMKTGIGSYAVQTGPLQIGAIVALNALGDIYDWKTGEKVAGLLTEDRTGFRSTIDLMKQSIDVVENRFVGNTTLGIVLTNAAFSKAQLCKIAGMAQDGFARSIRPVHTSADGDSIYAVSTGTLEADQDLVGVLAAEVVSEAILRAVSSAESAYGFLSAKDLKK